jgi:hypothetical protein
MASILKARTRLPGATRSFRTYNMSIRRQLQADVARLWLRGTPGL